jgi:multiple sugar transport system substrate-binding protein
MFEDLSYYMEKAPEINEINFFTNALKASRDREGRIYTIPATFSVNPVSVTGTLVENTELIPGSGARHMTFTHMLAYAKELYDASTLYNTFLFYAFPRGGSQIAYFLLADDYERFIDLEEEKAYFNTPDFIALIQSVYDLQSEYKFKPDNMYAGYHMPLFIGYWYYDTARDAAHKPGSIYPLLVSDNNGMVPLRDLLGFAVNAHSRNKELAWEFIRFMLTEEAQLLPGLFGIRVNKKAFSENMLEHSRMENEFYELDMPAEDIRDIVEEWAELVNGVRHEDWNVVNMMFEELNKFFGNEQTAWETVETLQSRADAYFEDRGLR